MAVRVWISSNTFPSIAPPSSEIRGRRLFVVNRRHEGLGGFPCGSLEPALSLVSEAGIRVVTPHPAILRIPGLSTLTEAAEWRLMDSPLRAFAGFSVFTAEKTG